jgi:hypothetical protein
MEIERNKGREREREKEKGAIKLPNDIRSCAIGRVRERERTREDRINSPRMALGVARKGE